MSAAVCVRIMFVFVCEYRRHEVGRSKRRCQCDAVDDPRNTKGKFQVENEPATINEGLWSLGRTLDVMLVRRSDRGLMEMAYMGDRIGFESICGGLKAWSIPGVRGRIGPSHDVWIAGTGW
jgi:hypothetical protein